MNEILKIVLIFAFAAVVSLFMKFEMKSVIKRYVRKECETIYKKYDEDIVYLENLIKEWSDNTVDLSEKHHKICNKISKYDDEVLKEISEVKYMLVKAECERTERDVERALNETKDVKFELLLEIRELLWDIKGILREIEDVKDSISEIKDSIINNSNENESEILDVLWDIQGDVVFLTSFVEKRENVEDAEESEEYSEEIEEDTEEGPF